MNKIALQFLVAGVIFLSSCNPKVSTNLYKQYATLGFSDEVHVIGLEQYLPDSAELLGVVYVGDTGFTTKCTYDIVLETAKIEARKIGGNAIKIVSHKKPGSMASSCHRIKAQIYKISNPKFGAQAAHDMAEEVVQSVDYATINIYRFSGFGALVNYDLYLGDSLICRVRNSYKTTIKVKIDGRNKLWAKTETLTEVPINIVLGRTYYVRCSISSGRFIGRPYLELMDFKTGKSEYESFNAKYQ